MCPNASRRIHWFECISLLLLYFLALNSVLVSAIDIGQFYPFGESYNDSANDKKDDTGSGAIILNTTFPFFGQNLPVLHVNENGFITNTVIPSSVFHVYKPQTFPIEKSNVPIIAGFWADVDTQRIGGRVLYRQTINATLLQRATADARKHFYLEEDFTWMFIATWDNVGYYGAKKEGVNKRNTFQIVLATNEKQSFTTLLYNKIEWTTGSNSGGTPETGLGGDPAQVGFNAGDQVRSFKVEGAETQAVLNLNATSNVGEPGKWLFGVGGEYVRNVTCNHDVKLTAKPRTVSMLGGENVHVFGPCFQTDIDISARIAGTNISFPCSFINYTSASCVMPPLFRTGEVTLEINPYGIDWNYSTVIYSENIALVDLYITRHNTDQWYVGNEVSLSWNSSSLSSNLTKLELLAYANAEGGNPDFIHVQSIHITNNDEYSATLVLHNSLQKYSTAVIRLSSSQNTNRLPISIYSDLFPVRVSQNKSVEWCNKWVSSTPALPLSTSQLSCPCTYKQASRDTGRFVTDPLCDMNKQHLPSNCLNRPGAVHCVLSNSGSDSRRTGTCCFNSEGDLIDIRDSAGGGTLSRYNYKSQGEDIVPYFTYFEDDLLPLFHCCQFSSSKCQSYLALRPPVTCDNYDPPKAAQAAGDPHLTTLDGKDYTFNGIGDFILMEDTNSSVVVQVRAEMAQDTEGKFQNASVFTAVAIAVRGISDVIEVQRSSQYTSLVHINGVQQTIDSSTSSLKGLTISKNSTDHLTDQYLIIIESSSISLSLDVSRDLINVLVMIGGDDLKGKLQGLLGNFDGNPDNDFKARGGTLLNSSSPMSVLHFEFGMTWEVSRNESLFSWDKNAVTSPSNKSVSYVPVFMDKIEKTDERNGTSEICQGNIQCTFDFTVTGNEAVAKSTMKFIEKFKTIEEDIQKVIRCPSIEEPANGRRNITGYSVGSTVTYICDEGYVVLPGSDTVYACLDNGQWSGNTVCVKYEGEKNNSSVVVYIATGATAGVLGFVGLLFTIFICMHCRGKRKKKDPEEGHDLSEFQVIGIPDLYPISPNPHAVFEDDSFIESLRQLSARGQFKIPRPNYVDPTIFEEFF